MESRLSCLIRGSAVGWLVCVAVLVGSRAASAQESRVVRPTSGYLFVDGVYIPPPYAIERTEDAIVVNGHSLDVSYFNVAEFEREHDAGWGRGEGRGRGPRWGSQRGGNGRGGRGPRGSDPLARFEYQMSELNHLGAIKVLYQDDKMLSF